jgi:hypothetical protein
MVPDSRRLRQGVEPRQERLKPRMHGSSLAFRGLRERQAAPTGGRGTAERTVCEGARRAAPCGRGDKPLSRLIGGGGAKAKRLSGRERGGRGRGDQRYVFTPRSRAGSIAIAVAASLLAILPQVAQASGPDPAGTVYVADLQANAIDVFAPIPSPALISTAPLRRIKGVDTKIAGPADVAVNSSGDVFVSNSANSSITEYAPGASGDATPINIIQGPHTGLAENDDMALATDGTLYVGNFEGTAPVEVFRPGATGDEAPIRIIAGPLTGLGSRANSGQTDGVGVDATGTLYAATTYNQTINIFKPGANGNESPTIIQGSATELERPDDVKVAFDGKLFVTSQGRYLFPEEGSIQVFAPHASGNQPPTRDIAGPATKLYATDDEAVNPSGRIYVTNDCGGPPGCGKNGNVGVFAPAATGNVAPEGEIEGADVPGSETTLERPEGIALAPPASNGTLKTTASPSPISVGGSTQDKATLSGGNSPTGWIVFKLFGPSDPTCSEPPAFISPLISVSGNGTHTSPSFSPAAEGTYRWVAEYSGDSNNPPLATACGDEGEQVTVTQLQWFSNGEPLPAGTKAQTISWGTLTFSPSSGGAVTCKKSDAGNVWNEGGVAKDETVLFDLYECRAEPECPAGVQVTASGLPWHSELERVEGVIRDKTTGISLTIRCGESAFTFTGQLTPKFTNMPGTAHPTFDEFGEGSGELELETPGTKEVTTLKVTGDDKMLGFEEGDEVITAEETEFPGLGRCVKGSKGTSRYKDSGCETPEVVEGGHYKWLPGAVKNKFHSTEETSTLELAGGQRVVCVGATDVGEYDGESEDRETMTFTGCRGGKTKSECQSAGAVAGEIRTARLRSLYGFIERPKNVGVSLEAVRGNFMEFRCGEESVVVRGSVIGPIRPVSKMSSTFTEKFKGAKGVQKVQKSEGEPTDILEASVNGGAFRSAAFTSADTVTNEEPLEIREAP